MFREPLVEILRRCPGLECLVLVGSDGLPIETVEAEAAEVDAEMLAAEIVALAQAARDNHREFGAERLRTVAIETKSHSVLLVEVIDEIYLVGAALREPSGAVGLARARFEMRRSRLALAPILVPTRTL